MIWQVSDCKRILFHVNEIKLKNQPHYVMIIRTYHRKEECHEKDFDQVS